MNLNNSYNLYYIKKEIDAIKKELEELNNLGCAVYSDTPKGTQVGDPTEKYVIKKMHLENKLKNLLNKYVAKVEKTNNFIEKIKDDEVRLIARLRYIENKTWNEIADELSKESGKYISEFAPRKRLNRYFEKNNKN